MATSGTNTNYAVYKEIGTGGKTDIFMKKSTDGGKTFAKAINISNNTGISDQPDIAVSGNNVIFVWRDFTGTSSTSQGDIFTRRSTDGGKTFSSIVNLSANKGESDNPRVSASGNTVLVVWEDNTGITSGAKEIFMIRSTDAAKTFAKFVNLSNTSGDSRAPTVTMLGNTALVVWGDKGSSDTAKPDINMRKSVDGGATFAATKNVSNDSADSKEATVGILSDGKTVIIAWHDDSGVNGAKEIQMKISKDGASTFGNTIKVSNNAGDSSDPELVVSGNNAALTWSDNTGRSNGNKDILMKFVTSNGPSAGTFNVSNNNGDSKDSYPAATTDKIFVVWTDSTTGNAEIFLIWVPWSAVPP